MLSALAVAWRSPAAARHVRSLASTSGSISHADAVALVAKQIASSKRIVVLLGAGASASAGLPDFRTPGTGLYDNLQSYGLPYPEAIFEIDFFKATPAPFYRLCAELWPGVHEPTATHSFVRLLSDRGVLQRCLTQNIDSLETEAGVPADRVVAAHGNFDGATVVGTGKAVDPEELRVAVFDKEDPEAALKKLEYKHDGLVKPNVVFFGEQLPEHFAASVRDDLPAADLLLVVGTSLQVHPFAGLVGEVGPGVPRVLINRERVGERGGSAGALLDFGAAGSAAGEGGGGGDAARGPGGRDVWLGRDCDDVVWELAEALGWERALMSAIAEDWRAAEEDDWV